MLINTTEHMQVIHLTLADGTKDSINLQPYGRATPPEGSTVDEVAYPSYVGKIKFLEKYKKTEAPAVTDTVVSAKK